MIEMPPIDPLEPIDGTMSMTFDEGHMMFLRLSIAIHEIAKTGYKFKDTFGRQLIKQPPYTV